MLQPYPEIYILVLDYYAVRDDFAKYKKDTAITAVHSRTGRRLHTQVNTRESGVVETNCDTLCTHTHTITAGGGTVSDSRR